MENLSSYINYLYSQVGVSPFFSSEILYAFGIFVNLIVYNFLKRKNGSARFSDIFTSIILFINFFVLSGVFLANKIISFDVKFTYLNNIFALNSEILVLKNVITIFGLLFLLVTYKLIRKTRIKTAFLNANLLFILLASSLLVQSNKFICTYLLLELCIFLIYKYASNMRIRKFELFSPDFVLVSTCASILFFAFYLMNFFVKEPIQQTMILTCMTLAILLKIGIFPLYNYLNDKQYKNNIPYAILLFAYFPILAVVAFMKLIDRSDLIIDVYQLSLLFFLVISFLCFGLYAIKQKNIFRFLASAGYVFLTFSISNLIFMGDFILSLKLVICNCFCLLAVYSLLVLVKLNLNPKKMTFSFFRCIFLSNKKLVAMLCVLLLLLCNIIPSKILLVNLEIVKNIYIFDEIGVYVLYCVVIANLLIAFNAFVFIKKCYTFDRKYQIVPFKKGTMLNYIIPFVVIIFLIIGCVL